MMEKPKIAGGKPVREKFLPFAQPLITDEEVNEVSEVLRSGWLTTGPKVLEFQDRFREYIGAKRAIAINSCTGGMHVALTALGIKAGDEVITTTTTFAATGHVIALLGAKPVLVDIEKDTYNIDPKQVEKAVTKKTKAILPVHYAGHPCEMDSIMNIAKEHNLFVVEDAAHTVGTDYKGKRIGTIGNATAFSFYAIKNMTTGEGGMITTNDEELADKMQKLLYFGINKDAWKRYEQAGSWYYEIETLGYKYNMDSMQGALGVVQLRKLDGFNKTRKEYAAYLTKRLENLGELQLPVERKGCNHVWHLYPILVKTENLKITRNEFIDALRAENIGTSVHFIPLHLHPFYQKTYGYKKGDFPNADYAFERMISLPLYPKMTKDDLEDVATAVEKIVTHYRK